MIEKDDIQELFSRSLENHTAPVRPEVWTGLQAKMAAAGLTTAAGATAAKGMSLLTKWIIGSAAAVTATVATTLIVMQQEEPVSDKAPAKELAAESANTVPSSDQVTEENQPVSGIYTKPQIGEPKPGQSVNNRIPAENSQEVPQPGDDVVVADGSHSVQNESHQQDTQKAPEESATSKDPAIPAEDVSNQPEKPETGKEVSIEKVIIPNVFKPDGDGMNDKYVLRSRGDVSKEGFSITIMDPQYKPVFTSTDPNFEWDGTTQNGDLAPAGTYSCIVIGKYINDTKIRERGTITLIRK